MTLDRTIPPPVSPFTDIVLPEERVETLPNGINFHYVDSGEQPISRLDIYWEGGFLDFGDMAASHILANAIKEQTASYSSERIADMIDFNGARLASRCADHYTSVNLVALNSRLPELMPLLASMATEATFEDRNIGVIARKCSSNQAIKREKVVYRASVEAAMLVQGKHHPASYDILPDDFESVTPETLGLLYGKLRQARVHVFLGGALGRATVSVVRDFLSAMPCGSSGFIRVQPFCPEPLSGPVHIEVPESQQSAVVMALPAIDRSNPDYIDLRLAIMALGGYFGSRLMHNIREEKGLTYGISASLLGSREGAYMNITAQCDADGVDRLIDESVKEIRALVTDPPRSDELHRLRQYAWSQLAATTDSSFGIVDHYITHLLVNTPDDYFQAQLRAIDNLSPARIAEVADKYIDAGNLRIVTCGR